MDIKTQAIAGSLESGDILISIEPAAGGLEISLKSIVQKQFGDSILQTVNQVAQDLGIKNGKITLDDKGALDCVIKARLQACIYRACQVEHPDWEVLYGQ